MDTKNIQHRAWRGERNYKPVEILIVYGPVQISLNPQRSVELLTVYSPFQKICLITFHPKGEPDKSLNVCAILNNQSNRSLGRSEFFVLFNLKTTEFPYTLRMCVRASEMSRRQAMVFIAHPLDASLSVQLPTLIDSH